MKYSFVVQLTPYSSNNFTAGKKALYKKAFSDAITRKYGSIVQLSGELHGRVFFITLSKDIPDADNISKPVWDALSGLLYRDDMVVKHREAVTMSFEQFDYSQTDRIDESDFHAIQSAHWDSKAVLFVELLPFDEWKVEFGTHSK